MEKTIKRPKLPEIDSVEALAGFWDRHDLTDFEHHLEEVTEPVFVRAKGASVSIELRPSALARIDPPLLIKGDPPSFKLSSN